MRQKQREYRGLDYTRDPRSWKRLGTGEVDRLGELDLFPMHSWDLFVDDAELP